MKFMKFPDAGAVTEPHRWPTSKRIGPTGPPRDTDPSARVEGTASEGSQAGTCNVITEKTGIMTFLWFHWNWLYGNLGADFESTVWCGIVIAWTF